MPIEMLFEKLKERGKCDIELRLILQSAPVLKGFKTSSMLFMSESELATIFTKLRTSSLKFFVLYTDVKRHLVLIYREDELIHYLSRKEIQNFLREKKYFGDTLEVYLEILRKRVCQYYIDRYTFPHEIGVFLGYPLCDIEGFLRHGGREFLFSGYWKIYDNLEKTKQTFKCFDSARDEAIEEYFSGKSICEIAC